MNIRLFLRKNWLRAAILLLAVVFAPYVFSRVASTWRCISVYSENETESTESPSPDEQLRVACFNIAHGRGLAESNWNGGDREERNRRLEDIAELLRKIDADIVVLNEVDFDSSWSCSVNQARFLARKAGYPYRAEQRNLDFRVLAWKWRFGNAVLSKYPITEARVIDLPGFATWETILAGKKRGVACDIAVGDRVLCIAGVHFSSRSEALRVDSAAKIVDIASLSELQMIVGGDLNSTPPDFPRSQSDSRGKNAIATLDESGHFQREPSSEPTTEDGLTYHAADPSSIIDWILIPGEWRFVRYWVEPSELSDHRAVYADLVPGETIAE